MGELIRNFEWESTALGPPISWPQSLKTSIRIMLMSRQPVWIGWGKDLIYFYNDPYFSIIGGKHPWALGKPTKEVWSEIWDVIGPMLETAMSGDEGTYVEEQLLIMERNGYPEETYFTFSYSPIPDDEGQPAGIICANTDDTQRVIGQRELALLRDLGARTAKSRSKLEACERSMHALSTNLYDIPFAAIYLIDDEHRVARLAGTSGIQSGHRLAPETLTISDEPYHLSVAVAEQATKIVDDLGESHDVPAGGWLNPPPNRAAVVPLGAFGETTRNAVLVAALSPYRLLDESYNGFLKLVAGQVAAAIADGEAVEGERLRLEKLAELDRAKTAFFANISHEFRTPLTLMLGPLQDVLSQELGPIPARIGLELDTVRRNGLRLQKMVNALLEFSRLEDGRMHSEFRPTDISTFTREIACAFESAMHRAGLAFDLDCPPLPLETFAWLDRDLWEKVILNLLSNALKHTFEGRIEVSVRQEDSFAVLRVTDTGVGIAKEHLGSIFERFRRVEGSRSRTLEGSGIGLALVHEIVKLHGGDITVVSEVDGPNHGSEFIVRIPVVRRDPVERESGADVVPPGPRASEAYVSEALRWLDEDRLDQGADISSDDISTVRPRSAGAKVLIADDNSDMRGYLTRLLSRDYDVSSVSNGEDALSAIQASIPDLVISDVMMPKLDGFQLVEKIRQDLQIAQLPVIILSARAGEEAKIEGLDAGADDYLVKPFTARELMARVDSSLSLSKIRREAVEVQRKAEERLQVALAAARMIAWEWHPVTDSLTMSGNHLDILGLGASEIITAGSQFLNLVHPDDLKDLDSLRQAAIATELGFTTQFRITRPEDGRLIWLEGRAEVETSSDGERSLIGVVMDITARKKTEQERAEAEAFLAAEMRILERITTGEPLGQVLNEIVIEIEQLSTDGMLASILLLDDSGTRLLTGAAPSLPDAYSSKIHGGKIGPQAGSCGAAAFEKRAVAVSDIEQDPRWDEYKQLALESGLRACTSVPISSSQGEILGTVAVYFNRIHETGNRDRELIERAAGLAAIVIERDKALASAEAERTRLRDVFSRAPAIICVLKGPEHEFELANPIFLRTVGRQDAARILGRPVREALPELDGQGLFELLDQVYASGKAFTGHEIAARLDQSGSGNLEEVFLDLVCLPSTNTRAEVNGILAYAVDVTEQVRARRKIEELAQELEHRVEARTSELLHANEQLQGFTYSVAHDLRQQIRGISMNAYMILEDLGSKLDSESQDNLNRLIKAAKQLGELVDDLLGFARLAKLDPRLGNVDLSAIASEVVEHIQQGNTALPNTRFIVGASPTVEGDRSMLRIVLENLIENSCKYSSRSSQPVIEFGYENGSFFVRDNGIGFDMAFAHKLFQPFERLHGDTNIPGTGIGLANVKRIVERHGGRVWATSEPGHGATFWFTIQPTK